MKSVVIHGPKDLRIEDGESEPLGTHQVRVAVEAGGICGSDLHYYNHGGFGTVRLKEPMVLGHEVAGRVVECGADVLNLKEGQRVAVSPSRPCGECRYCREGTPNQCLNMQFYGSAMPFPHIQGAFRQDLVANAEQCAVADGLSPGEAAMAEPLSVCLHATRRAGGMVGKSVLVTGCGPIGLLSILCARRAGADLVVATDVSDFTLGLATKVGADHTINVGTAAEELEDYARDKGTFDVVYECSGASPALASGIAVARPGATILQLGLGGDQNVPMMAVTTKELCLMGSFRFHDEFFTAVSLMQKGMIDVNPLITATFGLEQAVEAFEAASDRTRSIKTQLAF